MLSRLAAAFSLRSTAQPDPERERHVSWLELFLDLVFVLALDAVANRLSPGAPRAPEVAVAFALFVLVQWAWAGLVFYDTRYDPDDVPHRLLVLLAILAGATIALGVPGAPNRLLLPLGYLVIRGVLLLLYLRAWACGGPARRVTSVYLTGFGIGWALWLGSLAAPAHLRPAFWITAFLIELATPWLGIRRLASVPVDTTHLPERIGQFVIVLLGIMVARLLAAAPDRPSLRIGVAAAVAFIVPASIWWVYTTFVTARLGPNRLGGGQSYAYVHYLLGASLLFVGWSLGQVVHQIAAGPATLPASLRILLGASLITWMLTGLALNWLLVRSLPPRRLAITGSGIASVALVVALVADPFAMLGLLCAVLIGYAVALTRFIQRISGEQRVASG